MLFCEGEGVGASELLRGLELLVVDLEVDDSTDGRFNLLWWGEPFQQIALKGKHISRIKALIKT